VPLTCLIVDDSPQVLEAARLLLDGDAVTVVGVATTSGEALEIASELRPDVALVDVDLGPESGLDAVARLAALPGGGPLVILISAESGTELAELVSASGVLGFVSKTELSAETIEQLVRHGGE
jgi:DNA-binding NarL/FixJ family response regulator